LQQTLNLAIWEWASDYPDKDKLPEDFLNVIEAALIKEIRNNRRECNGLDVNNFSLELYDKTDEDLAKQYRISDTFYQLLTKLDYTKEQKDYVWAHLVLNKSVEEIVKKINTRRYRHGPKVTEEEVKLKLNEAKYFLKQRFEELKLV
jgi:hypothetical protein